jgi:hypothetical protein
MKGGSHSYGLQTPASDLDWRGVFINTDVATVVGLDKHEHQQKQDETADEVYTEFRNALKLLRSGNTQMVELLYADREDFSFISENWLLVQGYRKRLLSSETLFKCLRGYMQGELRLANGERTGKLGGKRKEALDKYGFSPKNFVQLFRLSWAGKIYFQKGYFPVNVAKENNAYRDFLLDIKVNPSNYDVATLNEIAAKSEASLVKAFEHREVNTKFDEELANNLCLDLYFSVMKRLIFKNYGSLDVERI